MTDKQIRAAKDALRDKGYTFFGFSSYVSEDEVLPTDKVLREDDKGVLIRSRQITDEMEFEMDCLQCRDMMSSILCYSYQHKEYPANNDYLKRYEKEIGLEKTKELWQEMWTDFQKATVHHNVHTDSEGCTYNSIDWGD